MNHYVNDWLIILRDWGTIACLPLMIGGAGLTLFGWRLWKLCTMLAFGLLGVGLGFHFGGEYEPTFVPMAGAGLLLAAVAFYLAKHAIGILGGLIGAALVLNVLALLRFEGPPFWIGGGVGFFAAVALSQINRRYVVIVVTAFLGAVLLISGIAAAVMAMPALYGTFRAMASYSGIVAPFLLAVPTVMSYFYQVSEVHRIREDL